MNFIIHRYIAMHFISYTTTIFLTISGIVLFFDTLELIRLSLKIAELNFQKVIWMALMKNYYHANKIWPFVIVLAVAFTYKKLSENFELYVLRSAGFSTFQIIFPIAFLSFCIGVIHITLLNPIGSYGIEKYQHLEAVNLKGRKSLISFSESGLWLKQNGSNGEEIIFHALRLSQQERTFYDVTFFYYDYNNTFIKRVDSKKATIIGNYWYLSQAKTINSKYVTHQEKEIQIKTDLTFDSIIESIVLPEVLSFWQLYNFIGISKNTGLIAIKHQLYFWQLFFVPLFLSAVAVVGYVFGIKKLRASKSNNMIIIAVLIQFFVYFASDFVSALAIVGTIPVIIAALFPFVVMTIIGLYSILHFEFS
ncbi:MAG: LptF/LptG family permease [Candidatus Midichloria sp.]|nr:MAG: LptF/LptG family permease [Candidatus Midichloria sp.]